MFARPASADPRPGAVAFWLIAVAALVFLMVVVGGITRLTESGLSITRWEPISGAIPPLTVQDWQAQFDLYKASPQYELQGHGMTLADFKAIFFWEYVHRLLGRLIGLAFALPLAWFWWRRAIPAGFGWKLGGLLALGALQGAIGWWMVASGLVDRPDVSHIRLAVHLLAALLIFAGLVWVALDLKARARTPLLALWALSLLFLQFLFGAYVAGLDAGYAFNTWPKMGADWYPAGAEWLQPALRNFVDNPLMVQFVHRWLAFLVAALAIWLGLRAWLSGLRMEGAALIAAVAAQVLLGILTIRSGVRIEIAVAHQAMAVLLLAAMVTAAHRLGEGRTGAASNA
ncbi:MAG: heme a synthase [Sphingomonadales bacterium]|jgi:cytochrome c oxidase assembly protein subunit 15|nr:heme a synthase [Sphingomonadales bacterium]